MATQDDPIVFVSSTYLDLAPHRRAIWEALSDLRVVIRGMEDFGARSERALDTCLAEVEQSDIYVGVIGQRLGTVDEATGRSYTQLEYERASDLKKERLIYLLGEDATIRAGDVEKDAQRVAKLQAFKDVLTERHTVAFFASPDDLAATVRRDVGKFAKPREAPSDPSEEAAAGEALRALALRPKKVVGREVRVAVKFTGGLFPASRSLCDAFRLDYGSAVGIPIEVLKPSLPASSTPNLLLASGKEADHLVELLGVPAPPQAADLYARIAFSPVDVGATRAEFVGRSYYVHYYEEDPDFQYRAPEGRIALLFTKLAA